MARQDAFPAWHKGFRTTWTSSKVRYLGHLLRVSYVPRFDPDSPYAVISFAPPYLFDPWWRAHVGVRLVEHARERLAELLALASSVDVTKLEIAVDLPIPIWSLQALCARSRRFRVYPKDDDRARTISSGSRCSWISLSTYDKRHQLVDRWEHDLGHELTRVEVRVKTDGPLAALASVENPFAYVSAHYLEPARGAPAGLKIGVRLARLAGLPDLRHVFRLELYRDLLAVTEVCPASWSAHPRRVFDRQWLSVATKLLNDLEAG